MLIFAVYGGLGVSTVLRYAWAISDLFESCVSVLSEDLLLQTHATPGPRAESLAGVRPLRADFAFWMCFSQAGELNLCRMICVDSSMSDVGTDGGSGEATMTLVPLWRISRNTSTRPATRSAAYVLVGLVEHDELVELTALVGSVGKHL